MNFRKITILFALYVLLCPNSRAQIQKLDSGSVVVYPSVCMDINTYRTIRASVSSSDQVIDGQVALLDSYKKQVENLQQGITARDQKIVEQDSVIVRKDRLLEQSNSNFVSLHNSNSKTLLAIERKLPNKSVLKRFDFWVGVIVGSLSTYVITK